MVVLVTKAHMSQALYPALPRALSATGRCGFSYATILACGGFSACRALPSRPPPPWPGRGARDSAVNGFSDGWPAGYGWRPVGTLGILIPPSVTWVLYGILDRHGYRPASSSRGIIPRPRPPSCSISLAIWVIGPYRPASAPAAPRIGWLERLSYFRTVGPILLLFVLIIRRPVCRCFHADGGGRNGLRPRRADLRAVGRSLSFGVFRARRWFETVTTTASLFLVLIGALCLPTHPKSIGLPARHCRTWILSMGPCRPCSVILLIS